MPSAGSRRSRQRYRTRKDLLRATARIIGEGKVPTMEMVAEESMVSRATAYRYFPNIEALLVEAELDIAMPDAATFFSGDPSTDPVERLDRAEGAVHDMVYANELALRHMLSKTVMLAGEKAPGGLPVRQNRRLPLIEAALDPLRGRMPAPEFDRLCAAVALVFGPESMIVFRDVLPLSPQRAREVKRWVLRALVASAMADTGASESTPADTGV